MRPKPITKPMTGATHNKDQSLGPAGGDDDARRRSPSMNHGGARHGCSGVAADQRMRGRGGQPQAARSPRPRQSRRSRPPRTTYWVTMSSRIIPVPIVLATAMPKQKCGKKVESGGPDDGQSRRENAGRDHGGDAVGGVVKSVQKVEDQRGKDRDDQQDESCAHGCALPGLAVRFMLGELRRSSRRRFPERWRHLPPCRWLLPGFREAL